jgi:hypothetical protein
MQASFVFREGRSEEEFIAIEVFYEKDNETIQHVELMR